MIVLDTSGVIAAVDEAQRLHEPARRALESDPGPFILSPFVLAEVDYLLATRVGIEAELAFLREVATGAYRLAPFGPEDVMAASALIDRYRGLGIGLADASVVVLAGHFRTTRLLTLDERHFRAIRPLRGRSFRLLPADL